jgi:hypothetical protein
MISGLGQNDSMYERENDGGHIFGRVIAMYIS